MQNAAQYRDYAEQCRALAKKANTATRQKLLKIAEAWERCADELATPTAPKNPGVGLDGG